MSESPLIVVPLDAVRQVALAASQNTSRGEPTYPDGHLSPEQWSFFAQNEGLRQVLQTETPLHIAYAFQLGPSAVLHHAIYFGQSSGPDGGLVIEVMNRVYNNEVVSFIAPSTLLSFLRRTATNNIEGLHVFQ